MPGPTPEMQAGRRNLVLLVQLRWLAVAGQFHTILAVHYLLDIALPLREMLCLLAVLPIFNLACWLRSREARSISQAELFAGLLVDVAVLTGLLYYSGGIINPFISLYLLQVAVSAVLLSAPYIWTLVWLTTLCFFGLTRWHRPLDLPDLMAWTLPVHYIGGLLVCFMLNASLLVIFIQRIGQVLRQRDARVAELRQRAAEEEHILRMGLLASGAAHELGTPLATLSVILGDWARMAPFAGEPELREEIEEMQVQIERCKRIVRSILLSAGEARGEASESSTLHDFLQETADRWRLTRPTGQLSLRLEGLPDAPIIADFALQQMIDNVLDNALEAAPGRPIELSASSLQAGDDDWVSLQVRDQGPGFVPAMLADIGKPYRSTKGRPGSGLGLFLAVNVARRLGGRIEAHNRPEGGAEVTLWLPLASLTPSPGPAPRTTQAGDLA